MIRSCSFFFVVALAAPGVWAQSPPLSFDEALQQLRQSPEFAASQSDIRSIELDYDSRELVLQPFVEVDANRLNDRRELLSQNTSLRQQIDSLGVRLTKPFSTGTSISVSPRYERALTPLLSPDSRDTVDWQISLSQNLWRDAFGRSTRLRRSREEFQRKQALAQALREQGELIYSFEELYWDWSLRLREWELEEANAKRGREILRWVQDRFRRSAAESTDLLQARALLAQKEIQVATLKLSLSQAQARMERYIPNLQWQPNAKDLTVSRPIDELPNVWRAEALNNVVLLQFLETDSEASAAAIQADETREAIRPELQFQLAYGKNAIDPDTDVALREAQSGSSEYSSIGVVLRTGLDFSSEKKRVDAARALRDAAVMRREARAAESRVAWSQLKRDWTELNARLLQSAELVDLQRRKANAERERYRKGRSTAFQAITFELEAAQAEILLWQLHALVRKTEARARLFAR